MTTHDEVRDAAEKEKWTMGVEVIKLQAEITRLKRIIAKQLVEEDSLGMEFTYVSILKEELTKAQDEVKRLHDKYDLQNLVKQNDRFREALEYIAWPGMDRDHWDRVHKAQEALKGGGDI